jgi:N-acetyl-anhydromuramoyl-L-alanine amidase
MRPSNRAIGSDLWRDGWYRFAQKLYSPNFGPRPKDLDIDLLVIHSISLPPGLYGGGEVEQLFNNQLDCKAHPYFAQLEGVQVSAHFYIRRSGDLLQFVSCDDRAWHAGASAHHGRENCNDFSIGIELEGIEGGHFELAQYESLASLCAALPDRYRIQHVAGHEHVAPGRKTDPGIGFDWAFLQQSVGWPSKYFPEGLPAVESP